MENRISYHRDSFYNVVLIDKLYSEIEMLQVKWL